MDRKATERVYAGGKSQSHFYEMILLDRLPNRR